MKEYIDSIVRPLLLDPASLQINESSDQLGLLLSVKVSKIDMGVIIGKDGGTSKSIKHLVHVLGAQKKVRASVKFEEPNREFTTGTTQPHYTGI